MSIPEVLIVGDSLPDAYHKAIRAFSENYQVADCEDWNLQKKEQYTQRECAMTVHVKKPLLEPMISKLIIYGARELEQYRMEILDGILDFAVEAGVEDYTYSYRMRHPIDQIQYAIDDLKRQKDMSSRRAVIGIRDNEQDTKLGNPACLQGIQLFVRGGELEMFVTFRSNDFANAFFGNAFALICLQKKIADELGVPVGGYHHRSHSMHVYERDYNMYEGFAKSVDTKSLKELVLFYDGNDETAYKPMMEEQTADILAELQKKADEYEMKKKNIKGNIFTRLSKTMFGWR